MTEPREEIDDNLGDLDAELNALDLDTDFSLWASFRSRKSIASSGGASSDRDLDLSIMSNSSDTTTAPNAHDDCIKNPNQLELHDLEYWRVHRLWRDEVFSPKYKPSTAEEKEFQDLVTFLGIVRKKMFEKQDEKWNELSQQTNIVLKRGPVLCQGQERELVLLSHGFVLAQVQEVASSKNAFARLMISRSYEQCELYSAIEYARSVPVTVDVIIEVEEDEEEETEEGVEVEVNAGETVVQDPSKEENEVVAINIGYSGKSTSGSDEEEDSSSSDDDVNDKDATEDRDDYDDESLEEEDGSSIEEKPETKPSDDSDDVDIKNVGGDVSHGKDKEEMIQENADSSEDNDDDRDSTDEEAKEAEKVDSDQDEVERVDTGSSVDEVKQVVTIDLDDDSFESEDELDEEAKKIIKEGESNQHEEPQEAPAAAAAAVASTQHRPFLGLFAGRKNAPDTEEVDVDKECEDRYEEKGSDEEPKDSQVEESAASLEASQDRRQFLGLFAGRKKTPELDDEEKQAKDTDGDDTEGADVEMADDASKEKEDIPQHEVSSPVGSPGMSSVMGFFAGKKKVTDEPAPDKENCPELTPEKHVKIKTPPKKKQVTIQEERHRFVIKTESDEFNFECATKLHKEAWVEAFERVLVKTRSRSRSNKNRVRGWQHVIVQTTLYSAAVTGLDELCCKEWLDVVNDLDKYNSLSPLHYAVMNNMMHIMDWLLSHGADPEVEDEDGRTPMYYAQRDKLKGAQALLLDFGAKRSQLHHVEERGELFQGAAQVAEAKAASKPASSPMNGISDKKSRQNDESKPSSDGDLKSHRHAATKAHGAMADAMNELRIRGEKINDLAEKANQLEDNVNTYGDLAKQMKARAKKKKWYNLK